MNGIALGTTTSSSSLMVKKLLPASEITSGSNPAVEKLLNAGLVSPVKKTYGERGRGLMVPVVLLTMGAQQEVANVYWFALGPPSR